MGLDLTILPLRNARQLGDSSVLCYDRLCFIQDYAIFCQLKDFGHGNEPTISTHPIPPQMWVDLYEDDGIKSRRDDKYETELTFVYAQQLKKLEVAKDASPKNRAIKAFIDALPDDTPIILYWR